MDRLRQHRLRITDDLTFSTVDTVGTIVIGSLLARQLDVNPVLFVSLLFVSAPFVHRAFAQETPGTKLFFSQHKDIDAVLQPERDRP